MNTHNPKHNTSTPPIQAKQPDPDDFDYLSSAAASGDCTGLIPSMPVSDAELESYEQIYPYLPPKPPQK